MEGVEASAVTLLKRAVELDSGGQRLDEAATCYQEGVSLLLSVMKATSDTAKKSRYRERIEQYLKRAEELKKHVSQEKEAGKYHEQIRIEEDSVGNSYERLFSRFIDDQLTTVEVEDPYIRTVHQTYNFLRFCELLVKKKSSLKRIVLTTGVDEQDPNAHTQQQQRLDQIRKSLQALNVQLEVNFSSTLHDREIRFDNGWVIKIGRGLDIYKATENKFSIGFCDFDLRRCQETTVDIYHRKLTKDGSIHMNNPGKVWTAVVLLQCYAGAMQLKERRNMGSDNPVPVQRTCYGSIEDQQRSLVSSCNASPGHYSSPPSAS